VISYNKIYGVIHVSKQFQNLNGIQVDAYGGGISSNNSSQIFINNSTLALRCF